MAKLSTSQWWTDFHAETVQWLLGEGFPRSLAEPAAAKWTELIQDEWKACPSSNLGEFAERAAERLLREVSDPAADWPLLVLFFAHLNPEDQAKFRRKMAVALEIQRRKAAGEWRGKQ
jgi:hypothetical protein